MNNGNNNDSKKFALFLVGTFLLTGLFGCSSSSKSNTESQDLTQTTVTNTLKEATTNTETDSNSNNNNNNDNNNYLSKEDIKTEETFEDSLDGYHAITADNETVEYANISVLKSGDSDGDEADFYGENSAIFATNGATLTIPDVLIVRLFAIVVPPPVVIRPPEQLPLVFITESDIFTVVPLP